MKQPKIVIVGAGPSGIAAASKLFENGYKNVTILEAENRIGGRVCTTKIGVYSVDLGGEWVHGEKGNIVYELAAPLGLLEKTGKQHYEKSKLVFDSQGNTLNDELRKNIAGFYYKYVEETKPDNTDSISYGEYIEKMFDKEFKNKPKIYSEKKKFLHHLELFIVTGKCAESWHGAAIEDDGYEGFPGDQMISWKDRGYSLILDILVKRIPDPKNELPVIKNTILNSEVKIIDYTGSSGGFPITITTTKGQSYKADHVIVTIPLGVLKEKHKSIFIPSLPKQKIKAIENLGYGSIAKIFLLFEKPFWSLEGKRGLQINFIWNEAERKAIEEDPEKKWILGMMGIVTVDYRPNLLMMFITGKYAKAMELLPDKKILSHTAENLHRFLDKKYNVTEPIAVLPTRWHINPHFRGTFTYRSVEAQREKVYPEMLEEPIDPENLKILFAGEATSSHRFRSVDGAIQSGWKAANRLIDYLKK